MTEFFNNVDDVHSHMGSNLKTKINLRKDVLSSWTKADPILGDGEMAIVEDESGQLAMKIGNGVSSFT